MLLCAVAYGFALGGLLVDYYLNNTLIKIYAVFILVFLVFIFIYLERLEQAQFEIEIHGRCYSHIFRSFLCCYQSIQILPKTGASIPLTLITAFPERHLKYPSA